MRMRSNRCSTGCSRTVDFFSTDRCLGINRPSKQFPQISNIPIKTMTLSITRAAVGCACVLLTGCASMSGIAPHAVTREANELASQHALSATPTSSAAWPKADWWKAYGDPQLDALIDEALASSPTLNVAAARTRKALALADASRSALAPRIDASASSTREHLSEHGLVPPPFGGTTQPLN
jgi:hypothetical protein